MLAHVAGSVSTDLNVGERMANPCVSQADCHSATTASVVWLLASDFIFTLCVSPCPGILILDVVQTRSFLDWSHTDAFDFSRLCLYQHWSWGQGGELVESNSSFGKVLWSWRLMSVPPQCQHDTEKTVYDLRFWHDDAWRESRASLVEEWNFMLDIRLGCESICKRVVGHIHWEFFFWRRNISFRFGQFVSLLTEAIFSFNFWETASIVSLGEAKNGFIFGINFWLRVWNQNLSFLAFVAGNSRLTCVGRDRMRAEWVVAALLWFYKHDSDSFALKQIPCHRLLHDGVSMSWHMLPRRGFKTMQRNSVNMIQNGVWSSILAWWRMKRVLRWLKNGTLC